MRTSRPGITLIEVLIAIFIMGIGMLAILVLFPLGALNMARALKDDRCASLAANADALATAYNLRNDLSILNPNGVAPYNYFNPTNPADFPPSPANPYSAPDPNGPGYPIFVDPYYLFANAALSWVGSPQPGFGPSSPIRRVTPNAFTLGTANLPFDIDRRFSLQDDLTFDPSGVPLNFVSQTGPLQRQGYFTYAYMLQRQASQVASNTQLWVIVYQGRPVQTPSLEPSFTATSNGSTTLMLTSIAGQIAPDLRRGNWLLDTTYEPPTATFPFGYVHAKFYKVVDATSTAANTMTVEVYPPIPTRDLPSATTPGVSQVVLLPNAVEVFDRGTGGQ